MFAQIIPFTGVGDYRLYDTLPSIAKKLKEAHIGSVREVWENRECTVKVPWMILHADNGLSFWFAKDTLFKISIEEPFDRALPNGIQVGMAMEEARNLDPNLTFDDWEEDWASPTGYWIGDSIETKRVISITVFIKEVLDDEVFDAYEWCMSHNPVNENTRGADD